MKTTDRRDPLLEAVLEETIPTGARGERERSLQVLLAGARRRRRWRRARALSMTVLVGAALGLVVDWALVPGRGRSTGRPEALVIVRTETGASAIVRTRADAFRMTTSEADTFTLVSTVGDPGTVEITSDDDEFLDRLPPGAGFIGEGPERLFVGWPAVSTDEVP